MPRGAFCGAGEMILWRVCGNSFFKSGFESVGSWHDVLGRCAVSVFF